MLVFIYMWTNELDRNGSREKEIFRVESSVLSLLLNLYFKSIIIKKENNIFF